MASSGGSGGGEIAAKLIEGICYVTG